MADDNPAKMQSTAVSLADAVAALRADFPAETEKLTVVDLAAPDARSQILGWVQNASTTYRNKVGVGGSLDPYVSYFADTHGMASRDDETGRMLIAVQTDPAKFPRRLPDIMRNPAYVLAHEAGHMLVKNGNDVPEAPGMSAAHAVTREAEKTRRNNITENCADTFAYLYCLKKGWIDAADIEGLATLRSSDTLNGDYGHFTSPALDALRLMADTNDIKSLEPATLLKVAAQHAETFSPARGAILGLQGQFNSVLGKPGEDPEKVSMRIYDKMAGIYLAGRDDTLEYYIARRSLGAALAWVTPEEAPTLDTPWSLVYQKIQDRSATETTASLLMNLIKANRRDMLKDREHEQWLVNSAASKNDAPRQG
ncbi:MAG: hypothetical protein ACAH80_08275 [Alphaproteobacteria bacterium]